MPKAKPFIKGEKFGKLTALGEHKSFDGGKSTFEKCICECGNIKRQNRNMIRRGEVISCGCARNEAGRRNLINANTTHGMGKSRIYMIYKGMRDRCRNPHNPCFNRYGGRGIKCYWENFEAFYEDMGKSYEIHCKKYGIKQTTIDRINVDGDYCKDNCRWATWKEQAKNKSKKIKI